MKTRTISFSSGKGGVGKTTLVCNLGSLWAKSGRNTLLVDADWSLGKLGLALGCRPQWTLEKVLKGDATLSEVIEPVRENLSLLASPSGVIGLEELDSEARRTLYFEMQRLQDQYDLILLDHASGVHWNVLEFAAACQQHIIVTTPEPTSYTDAYAIMKLLSKRFAIRDFQILVTMSQNRRETTLIVERFADVVRSHLDVRLNVLEIFDWEPKLSEALRRQEPFVQWQPAHPLTASFETVCRKIQSAEIRPHSGMNYFTGEAQACLTEREDLCRA